MLVTDRLRNYVLCIGNDAVGLNLRCSLLKENGWRVMGSVTGHEGIIRFSHDPTDAVVIEINDDGAEAALITGELKRLRPDVAVILLAPEGKVLVPGATAQANTVLMKSQEQRKLVKALKTLLPEK